MVNGLLSERVHVVHVVGSVVNLLQEVLQLLDEDALLEPLNTESQQMSKPCRVLPPSRFHLFTRRILLHLAVPGRLFDDVLEEDEPRVKSSLDLLQEEEDLLIV